MEVAVTGISYVANGPGGVLSMAGGVGAGADAAFVAKEWTDKTPGRSRGGGGHSRSPDGGDGSGLPNLCSFAGETHVLLADGTQKPIAELAVGEWVLAADPETGERGARAVTQLWVHNDMLVDLETEAGAITTTEDHPFWNVSDQAWQRADAIDAGEALLTYDGGHVTVDGIDWATRTGGMAYNLTVADLHTYFVIVVDQEVLVHNDCLSPAARKKLGTLIDHADETLAQVIRKRGGGASQVNQLQSGYGQLTLGKLAEMAVEGDNEAHRAIKMAKQAGSQGKGSN